MTSSELGGFDPTKRYGGKRMKKGICTMNQKLFIREALILKHGLEEGLKKYKEFSTILRMRAFEKFYLQSDASLFLEDEIAMVKNIISRVRKGYITEEFIVSSESVSPIMKALWVKLIQEEYDDSQILLMIRLIKKNRELFPGAALSLEDLEDRVSEKSCNLIKYMQNSNFDPYVSQIKKTKLINIHWLLT